MVSAGATTHTQKLHISFRPRICSALFTRAGLAEPQPDQTEIHTTNTVTTNPSLDCIHTRALPILATSSQTQVKDARCCGKTKGPRQRRNMDCEEEIFLRIFALGSQVILSPTLRFRLAPILKLRAHQRLRQNLAENHDV